MNFIPDIILRQLEEIRDYNLAEQKKLEILKLMTPVRPFTDKEATDEAKRERIKFCNLDFWYFDKIYFPKENYPDYAPISSFHTGLASMTELKDKKAHIVGGPRGFAKTATFKKKFLYDFLFGKRRYMAAASETLDPAKSLLTDIRNYLMSNERILFDYNLDWLEQSEEKLYARSEVNPRGTFADALSEERSSRGKQRNFFIRYDYIYATDYENYISSLTEDAIQKRIDRLNEMRTSLSDDGTLIWEGNNFDEACAMNYLLKELERGVLSNEFQIHLYPAWDEKKKKSLWSRKYPAKSETEMRQMVQPKDEYDWLGNFQQTPRKKSGEIFSDRFYDEYEDLPSDVKSVIFTDPNCSLKAKGDTTAITSLGFSIKSQKYYITNARCKSYSDPNELLDDLLRLRENERLRNIIVVSCGFDGNVAQESTWMNNIINFSRIKKIPFPHVIFRKYKVDDLVKNIQAVYQQGAILFPKGFRKTEEGKRYTDQLFSFISKKAKRKDDAPDSLVSAFELMHEFGIVSQSDEKKFISLSKRKLAERF